MQDLRISKETRNGIKEIEAEIHQAADLQNAGKLVKIEKELKRLQKLINERAAESLKA